MMNKTKWIQIALTACLLIMVSAAATQATVLRAFVSSTGSDANLGANCVQATPCRTFNVAIGAVTAGGELIALDTSGYGPITNINKAITIATVPGVTAFVVAAGGTAGFTINAGAADVVILRNINFNGSNAASTTGVQHNSGRLVIQNCLFQQLTTGLRVTAGEANLENNTISHNSVGVRAEGQGPDQDACLSGASCGGVNLPTPRVTVVRISNGMIADNTTAFEMFNAGAAGTRPQGACNAQNIFIRDFSGQGNGQPNIVGNPNFVSVTGSSDINAGCGGSVTIGSYSSQQQNQLNVANQ